MSLPPRKSAPNTGEEGYFLVSLVVVCFLLLLVLGIAAPRVAKQLEREREVESEHRAQEYVRAIQLYYRKNGRYPTSLDQLTGSGGSGFGSALNVKYLRQKYKDPLTGGEYRLIHQGEAKTEVKGFFGEPLQGIAAGNLGSAAGSVSNLNGTPGPLSGPSGQAGSPGSASQGITLGNTSSSGAGGFGSGSQGFGGSSSVGSPLSGSTAGSTGSPSSNGGAGTGTGITGTAGTGTAGSPSAGSGTGSGSAFGGSGGTDATSFQGSKGAIVGVASNAKGHGLVEWNGSENIEQWEFLYDPRVEQLKQRVSILGGSPAASGSGTLGSGFKPADGSTGLGFGQSGGASGLFNTGGFGANSGVGSTGTSGTTSGNSGNGSSTPGGTATPAGSQAPAP